MVFVGISTAHGEDLAIDLSHNEVAITTAFSGTDLLLFGATDQNKKSDIIVVVRGPRGKEIVRHKEHVMGLWINSGEMEFVGVPDFYTVASSRPLNEILPEDVLKHEQIGAHRLIFSPVAGTTMGPEKQAAYHEALLRNKRRQGLYTTDIGDVTFVGVNLFRTTLHFPAAVPVGDYRIETYLVRDNKIVKRHETEMRVHKIGVEEEIYNFAHQQAWAYGILAIIVAGLAGWVANAIFRKA